MLNLNLMIDWSETRNLLHDDDAILDEIPHHYSGDYLLLFRN